MQNKQIFSFKIKLSNRMYRAKLKLNLKKIFKYIKKILCNKFGIKFLKIDNSINLISFGKFNINNKLILLKKKLNKSNALNSKIEYTITVVQIL